MDKTRLLLTLCLAALSGAAVAQIDDEQREHSDERTKVFTEVDADRNDLLDRDEVRAAYPEADFDEMDEDDDGNVNRNEYFQYHRR